MKLLTALTASLIITGTQALASAGRSEAGEMGLLGIFFVAFIAMVVLFQCLPGLTMFLGILKGIFSSEAGKSPQEAAKNNRTSL